ncbi:hypothetical protein PR048_012942, partial [Dryococelus australis]
MLLVGVIHQQQHSIMENLDVFNCLRNSSDFQDISDVVNSLSSSYEAIAQARYRCFLKLYGASAKETFLNLHHYLSLTKSISIAKPGVFVLLPMKGAEQLYTFHVYFQVQLWLGILCLTNSRDGSTTTTKDPVTPERVLTHMFYKCNTGCGEDRCGCRKAAMKCTTLSCTCHGKFLNGIGVILERTTMKLTSCNHFRRPAVRMVQYYLCQLSMNQSQDYPVPANNREPCKQNEKHFN